MKYGQQESCSTNFNKEISMRFLFITLFIIGHGFCLAEDLPVNQKKTDTLTVQQATELVEKANATNGKQYELDLKWLTSIDRDVAR